MNILVDDINFVVKRRIPIKFKTDFRTVILFELLMQDNELSLESKVIQTLNLFYPNQDEIEDVNKAIEDVMWFYQCGKEENKTSRETRK